MRTRSRISMAGIAGAMLAAASIAAPLTVSAQNENWQGHFHGGDFSFAAGIGGTFGLAAGLALYPSVEWTIDDIHPGVPLAFGASARGLVSFANYLNQSVTAFGAGGFGIAHLGIFQQLDIYIGLGVAFTIVPLGFFTSGGVGFATFEGVNYFINESFAVYIEYVYWSYTSGASIGVLLKL